MAEIASRLLDWYERYGRKHLPWQGRGAYHVWISEIMLQQTQVATVLPYYERFVARFPHVTALADAALDDVLAAWSGLGYYARARNLHAAAQIVRDDYGGEFPHDFDVVRALPGIGRSTAGAILAQAHGARHAILDGNAKRVLARHEAIAGWPGKTSVAAVLWEVAERYTPAARVADYTQAIMDLGATVCARSRPLCTVCPLASDCIAKRQGNAAAYPGRRPATDKPRKATTMLMAVSGGSVYLERRPPAGIWGGLWSLPEIGEREPDAWAAERLGARVGTTQRWPVLRHGFTHFDLDISPVLLHLDDVPRAATEAGASVWYRLDDEPPGGLAAPVRRLLDNLREMANGTNR
jgi:A/G-specific adenine glycosylase